MPASTADPDPSGRGFSLDRFQLDAIAAIERGESVLVSAPTGSGKTVVAEHAIGLALRSGRRAFYTTPIKALSNQKFHDLVDMHGADAVGLLTGDTSINGDAPVVVMTTEVLRNMIYSRSDALDALDWVVLDEVHYLQDAYRGPVWEEVIIHLPLHVRLVCLSATVSNAEELAGWISTVRGPTTVVEEHRRPVELDSWYMAADRDEGRVVLLPTFVDGEANPRGSALDPDPREASRRGPGRARRRHATPDRVEVVELLAERAMLPAIHFIFSRAACDDAVTACMRAGLRFTDDSERARIRTIVEEHVDGLSDEDLTILRFGEWADSLERGIASHHAGLVPPFKEAVERCFIEGLVKVVFATETLALGVNMPARSVVIEKLTKFTGERHEFLTPAQFTQLTGRAGRRGIDEYGHAIVLWSPFVTFDEVAALAGSRSFRLTSSFHPTYNMAANLVRRYDAPTAHHLLGRSFAQYQADADVAVLVDRAERRRARADELRELASCELGDADEYRSLVDGEERRRRGPGPDTGSTVERALLDLHPGAVLRDPSTDDLVVVVSVAHRRGGSARLKVLRRDGSIGGLGSDDFDRTPVAIDRIRLPEPYAPTREEFQREVLGSLLALDAGRSPAANAPRMGSPRTEREPEVLTHAVHGCPDRDTHLRALRELGGVERELRHLDRRIGERTGSLVREFERILEMLEAWGHLDGWALTDRGERLVRIFHECDLAIAEAIECGLFDDVDVPTLAGLASVFVYESRASAPELEPWFPDRSIERRVRTLEALTADIAADERALGLPPTRIPDPGFFGLAHAWAAGDDLSTILGDDEIPGGDFVRVIRQLIDLLRQIGDASGDAVTGAVARSAADALLRGVVAASGTRSAPIQQHDDAIDEDLP